MSHVQSSATELAQLFDESSVPVYVLDEDRRIVFANRACARWTGLPMKRLIGLHCAWHSDAEPGATAAAGAGLCPPPQVFSGQTRIAVVHCPTADGQTVYRRGHFLPLSDGGDESAGVVAILEPADCSAEAALHASSTDDLLHEQLRRLRRRMATRYRIDSLLGDSPPAARARAQVALAATSGASVLVVGPVGSGKDHVAKSIHYYRSEPGLLLPLDCAILDVNLLRSALRSAWAKISGAREGVSTLLLADVDVMPAEAQSDLVELLQLEARPGRLIATATRPLGSLAAAGEFSPLLAGQLSTLTIELPALAERMTDLPLLAQLFLEEVNARGGKQVAGFTDEALDLLCGYSWPENLDELAAVVRQAHERSQGAMVAARDLSEALHCAAGAKVHPPRVDETIVLGEFLASVEKELIERAMKRAKGNKTKAAKLLGLTRPRLYRRLIQLGMEPPDFQEV